MVAESATLVAATVATIEISEQASLILQSSRENCTQIVKIEIDLKLM